MRLDRAKVGSLCKAALPVAGAVALTPLLLFVSTTNTLFIRNATDFVNDVHVLDQFLTYFVLASVLGLLLFSLARFLMPRLLSLPFWLYVLAGPFFLVYAFFHVRVPAGMDRLSVCGTFAVVYFSAAGLLTWKGKLEVALAACSRGFVVFLLIEALIFVTNGESRRTVFQDDVDLTPLKETQTTRPNIYHIVFDQYATEFFEQVLTPELRSRLAGFQYFPENITPYSGTQIAIPSVFHGHPIPPDVTKQSYETEAFSTETSFLYPLTEAGYDTYAFLSVNYWNQSKYRLFRHRQTFSEYADVSFAADGTREFRTLWVYAHFPAFVSRRFISAKTIDELTHNAVLPQLQPVTSYVGFKRFLREEESLPDQGRYTFMHVMLPHGPYVLRRDGSYGPPLEDGSLPATSIIEQTYCATDLLVQFIERLSKLRRFDDSMVIVHADHGARSADKGAELCLSGIPQIVSRSRALLLLKLPGRDASTPFEVCDLETSLFDIAPTVLDAVGISHSVSYPGISLTHQDRFPTGRQRLYAFYNEQKGWDAGRTLYLVEGKRYTNRATGRVSFHRFLTPAEERYFAGSGTLGGFEQFPEGAEFPAGWGGLLEAPTCEPENGIVKSGKYSVKLTSSPTEGERSREKHMRALIVPPIERLRGKELVFGLWVHTSQPEKVKVQIIDSWQRYHGVNPRKRDEWELVTQRAVISEDAKVVCFTVAVAHDGQSPTVCYADSATLIIHEQLGTAR